MRLRRNEQGIALAIVMLLALVAVVLASAMLYMTARWAGITGMEKQYKTAYEAALGGTDVSFNFIGARGDNAMIDPTLGVTTSSDNCVGDKLTKPTGLWRNTCDNTIVINPLVATSFDFRFDLGSYRVYSKIVDTVEGNSAASVGLETANSVANSGTGEVQVFQMPFLYTIEILSERAGNPAERSRVSVLYQY